MHRAPGVLVERKFGRGESGGLTEVLLRSSMCFALCLGFVPSRFAAVFDPAFERKEPKEPKEPKGNKDTKQDDDTVSSVSWM